jgi:hypothetical protein
VIGVDRHPENRAYFIVRLYVPNPVWEENVADTDTATNPMTGDSDTIAIVNSGNRKARPTFTLTPQTVKDTLVDDFALSLRGFVVNRSPYPFKNYPVQLFATADGAGDYDTAALVKVAADTAALNGNINASITSIAFDGEAGAGLDSPDGMIFIEDEQIYYTGNDGSTLTGCVRGIGGTTAAGHTDPNTITRSRILENGDDIVVWINGVRVERWLHGMNTANTKLWVNLSGPARKKMTARAAVDVKGIESNDPADGGTWRVEEDISDMPESGQFVVDDELITYTGRDLAGKGFTTIERGAWGSTAAGHTPGTDPVYRCDYLFIIGASMGRATFFPPEASIERRPCIQLGASLPNKWYYGDESDDSETAFLDKAHPNRSAQFRALKQQASDDLAPALRLEQSEDQVGFKDAAPAAGKLDTNQLTLSLAVPIEAAANAITYDAQPRLATRLLMKARDEAGLEVDLADLQDVDEGHLAAEQITPASRFPELSLMAVSGVITGSKTGTDALSMATPGYAIHQKFVLNQDSTVTEFQLSLHRASSGDDFTFDVDLTDNADPDDPANNNVLLSLGSGISDDTLEESPAYAYEGYQPATPLRLAAGTYGLRLTLLSIVSGTLRWRTGVVHTPNDRCYFEDASPAFEDGIAAVFNIIHDGTGPVQAEAENLRQETEADYDKLILDLDDAAADNMVPQVRREASFGVTMYHFNGVLTNDLNSDTLTFDVWVPLTKVLTIDCEDQVVTLVEGNHSMQLAAAVTPTDITEWAAAEPGTNTFTWTEAGMTDTDLAASHRGVKV